MKRPSNVQSATHISSWLTSWDRNQLRNACIRGLSSSLLAGTDAMNSSTPFVIGSGLSIVSSPFWGSHDPAPLPFLGRGEGRRSRSRTPLSGPEEAGPEDDEQSGEQAERHHSAGLDKMEGRGGHAQRRSLRVGVGLKARPLDRELGVGLGALALKVPAPIAAFGAFACDGLVDAGNLRPQVPHRGSLTLSPGLDAGIDVGDRKPARGEEYHHKSD